MIVVNKMSTTTKTYNVNQIKQLIELNGNLTNFSADFLIESKNFTPFKALVISETDLNSGNPITYQEVKDGKINGNITNDKGVHDSYFILLKSDEPTECQVTINLQEVPLNPDIIRYQEELAIQQKESERQQFEEHKRQQEEEYLKRNKKIKENFEGKKKNTANSKSNSKWFFYLLIGGLICAGIYFLMKKKKKPLVENKVSLSPITVVKNIEPVVELPQVPVLENPLPKVEQVIIQPPSTPVTENFVPSVPEINIEAPKLIETPAISGKKNVDLVNKINNFFGK